MNDRNEIERNMYAVEESIVFRKPREERNTQIFNWQNNQILMQ